MPFSESYKGVLSSFILIGLLLTGIACESPTEETVEPPFEVSSITREALPELADGRTYFYTLAMSPADPESVFIQLWQEGVPVNRAWLPLDNQCEDPVGPRFTVELIEPDERMVEFNFKLGTDRLFCAIQLKQFVITE